MSDQAIAVDVDEEPPAAFVEAYWAAVEATLTRVFYASAVLSDEYRARLELASPRERLLVFHATPLQVAADLTLTDIVTKEQADAYLDANRGFLARESWV